MSSERRTSLPSWNAAKENLTQLRLKITNIRRSNIVFEAAECANVPFHLQGRLSLNTDDVINRRLQLRRNPDVTRVLEVWWTSAQNTQNGEKVPPDSERCALLSKDTYVLLSRKLYRATVEEWDEDDALAVAEEEWAKDSVDDRMGKEVFMDCIFEFADMYTLGVSAEEYVHFLWKLFWIIARGSPPDGCIWKDDCDIVYIPINEDPAAAVLQAVHGEGTTHIRPSSLDPRSGRKLKPGKGHKTVSSHRKLMNGLSMTSRLLQTTVSSRALQNSRTAPSSPATSEGSSSLSSGSFKALKFDPKLNQPTRVESGLAMALMKRRSTTTMPSRSSLRTSSMRRQSLALDAKAAAAGETAPIACAAPLASNARRVNIIKARKASEILAGYLLAETISISETISKHLTLRSLRSSRQRVGPEPYVGSKRHQILYKAVPPPAGSDYLPIATKGVDEWRTPTTAQSSIPSIP